MSSGPLVVPWEFVCHDNHRLMPAKIGKYIRLIMAPGYRAAKRGAELTLKQQWRDAPLTGAVEVVGLVFMPDRRKRDPGNYRKLCTDSLSGIVYLDDAQIERETWIRAGVDTKRPRIEITLTEAASHAV